MSQSLQCSFFLLFGSIRVDSIVVERDATHYICFIHFVLLKQNVHMAENTMNLVVGTTWG